MFNRFDFGSAQGKSINGRLVRIQMAEGLDQPVYHNMSVFVIPHYDEEDDQAGLALCDDEGNVIAFGYVEDVHEDMAYPEWIVKNMPGAAKAYSRHRLNAEDYMVVIHSTFRCLGTIDRAETVAQTSEALNNAIIRQFIPAVLDRFTATELRNMAAAADAKPNSIRKDDVIAALQDVVVEPDETHDPEELRYYFRSQSLQPMMLLQSLQLLMMLLLLQLGHLFFCPHG